MDEVEEIIKEEIAFLSNYKNATIQIENNSEHWSSYTLSHGYPGLILFLNEYQRLYNINLERLIHQYILKIGRELERGVEGFSLYSGLSGIAFSIDIISKDNNNYQIILNNIDDHLIRFVNQKITNIKIESVPKHYDVIQGLTGVGRYLLNRVEANPKVLSSLIKIMSYFKDVHYSKNHWIVSKENQFLDIDKHRFTLGNINLGLAHGILGPFSLLSLCKLKGIEINHHTSLLSDVTDYIYKPEFQNSMGWLDRYDIAEKIYTSVSVRNGWCYGDTGIMNTIWLLGLALNDNELIEKAKRLMLKIVRLTNDDLISPTFCHGLASHLTIINNVNSYFNIVEVNKYLDKVTDKIMTFYSSENPCMFRDIEMFKDQQRISNKVGLLEGQIGTLLSLLNYKKRQASYLEKSWTNMFLIN
ncbi:lanthionine synthetase C family protein [Staphylococcus saccharolyticus]|uniref:lanthionine synthetase C family protein n=1 Tax=Staphylococcus saccharolyticus TaxID=33028 RepID=UPI0032DE58A4